MPSLAATFLFFVGMMIFLAVKTSLSAKVQGRIPEELELNSVRDAVMEKLGWSLDRAESARTEYVRFLTLLQRKPGFMLVPWNTPEGKDDLDQFWHQHILDTEKYVADCHALFGRLLHHNPHVVRGSGEETDAVAKTRRLYARTFESGSYGRSADAADFTGCGACAAVVAEASSSDSSHGDGGHGHGCGGHGCGGSGCGGHGCGGSGCGGH